MSGSEDTTRRIVVGGVCVSLWPFALDAAFGAGWPDWSVHRWGVWLTGVAVLLLVFAWAERRDERGRPFGRPVSG